MKRRGTILKLTVSCFVLSFRCYAFSFQFSSHVCLYVNKKFDKEITKEKQESTLQGKKGSKKLRNKGT